jgi:D-apiose dehydrogenase
VTYQIGLVGCGWIAAFQVEGWRLIPNVEVVAACDSDREKAEALARRFGIGWFGDDPHQMLDAVDLHIVDIATPPDTHKALAFAAMDRGLHVLCQKPAALTIADARTMIEMAQNRGVALYINEMLRFCGWFIKARELIEQDAIGTPTYARLSCRSASFLEVGPQRWMSYGFRDFVRKTSRGIILEETIHYFDVARYLLGEPRSIWAAVQRVSAALGGEDTVIAILRYPDRISVIENSWAAHGPERLTMEIEGTEGAILMSTAKVLELHCGRTGRLKQSWDFGGTSWAEQRPHVFAALFGDFLSMLDSCTDRTAQALDNLRSLRLTLMAYDSAERHAELEL